MYKTVRSPTATKAERLCFVVLSDISPLALMGTKKNGTSHLMSLMNCNERVKWQVVLGAGGWITHMRDKPAGKAAVPEAMVFFYFFLY